MQNEKHTTKSELNHYIQTGSSSNMEIYPNFHPTSQSNSIYHNDSSIALLEKPLLPMVDEDNEEEIYNQFPLFFKQPELIKVPSKCTTAINHLPKFLLEDIHQDIEVAKELCLIFLSNLTDTYFTINNTTDTYRKAGWKNLKAEFLDDQLGGQYSYRRKIVEALEIGTNKGKIIECDKKHLKGAFSFSYRLGDNYKSKGVESYQLKTDTAKRYLARSYFKAISKSIVNPICKNLIHLYGEIELPSVEEIKQEAKRLIKESYVTKKRKKLTFLNKHPKSYFKNFEERSFVEDAIEIYDYLTGNGFMVPRPGDDKSGGRVVDSFALMPSWIRALIKINGQRIGECDYVTLHPNIAISLYGGRQEFLSHTIVENATGINSEKIKTEHLSFFNKTERDMNKSDLYKYYNQFEKSMLINILEEKQNSPYEHKVTSMRMFKKEVDVMTSVIGKLNAESIYVGYVYDALFCKVENLERVKQIMDETILEFGVKTTASIKK